MTAPARQHVPKGIGEALVNDYSTTLNKVRLLKLGQANFSFDFPIEKIFGGNSLYPFDTMDKERTATVKFTNNEFDADILAALSGATVTRAGSTEVQISKESGTIPGSVSYTVTLAKAATAVTATDHVYYADTGVEFTRVASGPTAGQYSISSGVLTFAAADASKAIYVDYRYTVTDGDLASILTTGTIPVCQINYVVPYKDKSGNNMKMTITIFKAKATGKLDMNFQRGNPATFDLEFEILDPELSSGKLVDVSFARL